MRLKNFIYLFLLLAVAGMAPGCRKSGSTEAELSQAVDWTVTLNHESQTPYGASIAYETLPYYFPQAKAEPLTKWFRYNNISDQMREHSYDSANLLVMAGLNFYVTEKEWTELKRYMHDGNEIVLFCSNIDVFIEKDIHCHKENRSDVTQPLNMFNTGENSQNILRLGDGDKTYGYNGRSLESCFNIPLNEPLKGVADTALEVDSVITEPAYSTESSTSSGDDDYSFSAPEVLGTVTNRTSHATQPDFIRYRYGKGHLTIHAAPLTLSNYFLLQPGNEAYLNGIWHTLPDNIQHIYWNDFYTRKHQEEESGMKTLWQYTATRMGMLILLLVLLLYVIFESKRRQRIIPVLPKLTNSSVAFVETVGRLYFHQGNHRNLANKMVQHFLEWVRTSLYLDTNKIDSEFARQLQVKSGMPAATVQEMIHVINEVRSGIGNLPDEYLLRVHNLTQSFYNQKK